MAVTTSASNALLLARNNPQLAAYIEEIIGQSGQGGATTKELALKESQYGQSLAEQIRQFNEQMAQRKTEQATTEKQYQSDLAKSLLASPYASNQAALGKLSQTLGYPLATPTTGTTTSSPSSLSSVIRGTTSPVGGSNTNISETLTSLNAAGTALDKLSGYDYNVPGLKMETDAMRRAYTQALHNVIGRLGLS